jgi:hypothetical protein
MKIQQLRILCTLNFKQQTKIFYLRKEKKRKEDIESNI